MKDKQMYIRYLYEVAVLEDRKRFWEELRDIENKKKATLQRDKNKCANSKYEKEVDLEEVPNKEESLWIIGIFLAIVVGICCNLFFWVPLAIVGGMFDLFDTIDGYGWLIFKLITFVGACITYWASVIDGPQKANKKREEIIANNAKKKNRYEQKKTQFEENKETLLSSYDTDIWMCNINLSMINKELSAVEQLLKKYYATGILYPTYHNPRAVVTILQYLQSGRCEGLNGTNGAYNMYEAELRMDTVIEQLKIMNFLMRQLVQNTANILAGVRIINSRLDEIQSSLITQQDLMTQYNKSIEDVKDNVYLFSAQTEAMESLEKMKLLQQQQTNALLEYQNFAIKQERLANGRYS